MFQPRPLNEILTLFCDRRHLATSQHLPISTRSIYVFSLNTRTHSYNTRHACSFGLPYCRTISDNFLFSFKAQSFFILFVLRSLALYLLGRDLLTFRLATPKCFLNRNKTLFGVDYFGEKISAIGLFLDFL